VLTEASGVASTVTAGVAVGEAFAWLVPEPRVTSTMMITATAMTPAPTPFHIHRRRDRRGLESDRIASWRRRSRLRRDAERGSGR
jgi:hypothetical protein